MTMYDSSGRPIGTRKTNVVAGSLNPYWYRGSISQPKL